MRKFLLMVSILSALLTGLLFLPSGCARDGSEHPAGKRPQYQCPMHPAVVRDTKGSCPICGMDLVPMEVREGGVSAVPGRASVSIATDARTRMGLTLGTVGKRAMTRQIRTSARIVADETRLFRVTAKVEGWVDKLLVSVSGQAVHKGDPLLTIYSPQLVSAQQEFLSAMEAAGPLAAGAGGDAAEGGRRLMDSARERLQLWDVSDEQISRLEKTRRVEKTLALYAPVSGFVLEKEVLAGQKIMPGDSLMVVADLSSVWGEAAIYESDLPSVRTGMTMRLSLPYWPEKTFEGSVSFLSPALDPDTRTLKIRIEITNPESLLKLEMYADARLSYELGERVAVPESAVMRTGERSYAFRDDGGGKLIPVAVRIGARSEGYFEVLEGLVPGDRVVTSANFLVDSESSMRAALDAMEGEVTMADSPVQRVIEFSARNRVLVILLVAAAVAGSVYAMRSIRLDAIPDLSDTQVIVYSKWDRSPDIVEDQVTYPIVSALLGAPRVKAVRGLSDFGFSYVYVIFQDGTDIYWARSRVVEYLSRIQGGMPAGVTPELGPDATGVGWVFQYALVDKSGKHDLAQLRTFQDWVLRYALQSVPGVSEVAGIGGFQKQYQITIDPNRLQSYGLSLMPLVDAIRRSSNEVGGRLIEWSGREYMVRCRGYVRDTETLEKIVVKTNANGTPVLLGDVAAVALGPQLRRGVADLNGEGDAVGGIVVMRHGENALNVIRRVKAKLEDLKPSLPEGVEVVTTYDRSELIRKSVDNLKDELLVEMLIVSLVIMFFLWHIPSASVPIITIPIAVSLSFIPMYFMGITSNIMSISGIAISIGVLVDGAIVEVENAYKRLDIWNENGRVGDFHGVLLQAIKEVAPSVFFSLLVIAVSFLPVFTLLDQEGRLFKPLAYTKTLVIGLAALLAVTLNPAIRMIFVRMDPFTFRPRWLAGLLTTLCVGRYRPEERHPVSRVLFALYERPCRWVLRHPKTVIGLSVAVVASTVPVYLKLGSEFMPPLNEEVILYMPTTMPGLAVTEAQRLLETQDRILKAFPEVVSVFGKAGRADTSTDPAPFSMMETTVVLRPPSEWRPKERWYTKRAPKPVRAILGRIWPEHISWDDLIGEMDRALQIPGSVNAWTMPIKGRIDMLSTGVRTPVGIKILGSDLSQIQRLGEQMEGILRGVPGTRSVFAERASGGYFVDIVSKREALARYGLTLEDIHSVVMTALGGETVATTIEGRERYSINVRYPRDLRANLDQLSRILVTTMNGVQVPMVELAELSLVSGPSMIRDENGMLAGYVYVDISGRDVGGYVDDAKRAVSGHVKLPTGYSLVWSGQYENMLRVRERLKVVVPVTILLIFLLLYMNTKSAFKALVVMLAVPFSLVGAVWLLYLLGYNISIAVWVGMIALAGLDAETGVFMLMFLDLSYEEAKREGRLRNKAELVEAIIHGAVKRIRPKMMTVAAASMGLMPIMWSAGTGADLMKRVAAPMVGGLFTSFIMELLVYPAIFLLWRSRLIVAAPAGESPPADKQA